MLKNAYFVENYKIQRSVGGSAPDRRVVTAAYYYNFVEFFLSLMHFFTTEENNYSKCSTSASSAPLHLFFSSNSVVFVGRDTRIFLAPGRGVP